MFDSPVKSSQIDEDLFEALNVFWILHADHEQNCSTLAVRLVGSGRVNLYAAVSAGLASLWGPLHGGANQAVIEMLERIRDDGGDYQKYMDMAKDKASGFRLMGFGHRVYKNFDPRMTIIKDACSEVLEKLGTQTKLLEIAMELQEIALHDDYFVSRKLYPNVDFYSGVIYNAIGTPSNLFTVLFALVRLPGWIAQWKEMMEAPDVRIGRPRQIYMGATKRDYQKGDSPLFRGVNAFEKGTVPC